LGEVQVVQNGGVVPADKLYGELTTPAKWRRLVLVQRRSVDTNLLQSTRTLSRDLFSEMGPETEEALFNFLKLKLKGWETDLLSFKPLAETGSYPGKEAIADGLRTITQILTEEDSFKCIERFNGLKQELQDLADSFQDLKHFYERQKPAWEGLRKALDRFQPNRRELDRDAKAGPALQRMGTILAAPRPYGLIKEASGLIQTVAEVNDALVAARRAEVLDAIARQSSLIDQELVAHSVDTSVKEACLAPIQTLKRQVQEEQSLAHLAQAQGEAMGALDDVVTRVEKALKTVVRPASPSASSAPATPSRPESPSPASADRRGSGCRAGSGGRCR
jgi:cell fate (sporulation/competence/biofilm development) regulator YlbF (YheA/YmcA/DUF963 family)